MLILGVETSCDDTGLAVVADGAEVLSNLVSSQLDHAAFGGIVPEIAARRHLETLPLLLPRALDEAGIGTADIDGVGITRGPGLIGALLTGWCFGRGLARSLGVPWVGVHHLAAHVHGALMPALHAGRAIPYPLLGLVVSGGHTALYRVPAAATFELVGKTRDDAAGEAFDKVASLLGLGFPGGPVIDRLAANGDPEAVPLPRADLGTDFSFSGLKTAVRREALARGLQPGLAEDARVVDLVASFQAAAVDMLVGATRRALAAGSYGGLVLAGGVAANRSLRAAFERLAEADSVELHRSPPRLSTDNGAMIAGAAHRRLVRGECDPWELAATPAWELGVASS